MNKMLLLSVMALVMVVMMGSYLVEGKRKSSGSTAPKESQTITPWEYCEGCKVTVDLFSRLSLAKLQEMQAAGVKSGSGYDAAELLPELCEDETFKESYAPAMHWTCLKILQENSTKFTLPFEGSSSAAGGKARLFDIKKEVCVNQFQACQPSVFEKGDVPVDDRDKCSACKIVAADLYAASTIANKKAPISDVVESICSQMPFLHKPYAWIESYCDEMIEENADEITEVIQFRKRIKQSGLNPDKSLADSICGELFDCDEEQLSGEGKRKKRKPRHGRRSHRKDLR